MEWVFFEKEIPYPNTSNGRNENDWEQTVVIDGRIYAFTYHDGHPGRLQVLIFNEDDVSWDLVQHAREPVDSMSPTWYGQRYEPAFVVVARGHVAYLIKDDGQGSWNVHFFDVETLRWGQVTPTGHAPQYCGSFRVCAVNDKMLLWQSVDSGEVFGFCLNLNTMVWSKLPESRMSFRSLPEWLVAVDDKVYALIDDMSWGPSLAYYDTTTETYVCLDSLRHDHRNLPPFIPFLCGGYIYVVVLIPTFIFRYSIHDDKWRCFTYSFPPPLGHCHVSVVQQRVYFFVFSNASCTVTLISFLPSLRHLALKAVARDSRLDTACLPATLQTELSYGVRELE